MSGYSLIDTSDPMNPIPLGRQGDISMTLFQDPFNNNAVTMDIASFVTMRSLNRGTSDIAYYGVTGTAQVDIPGMETQSIDIPMSSILGYGERLLRYQDDQGTMRYESTIPGSREYNEYIARYGADAIGWATARETGVRSLVAYIAENMSGLVEGIKNAGGMNGPDGWAETGSEIVTALANMSADQFQYGKNIRIAIG